MNKPDLPFRIFYYNAAITAFADTWPSMIRTVMNSSTPILVRIPDIDTSTPMAVSLFLALQDHSSVGLEVSQMEQIQDRYGHLSEDDWSDWTAGHVPVCRDLLDQIIAAGRIVPPRRALEKLLALLGL